MTRIPNCPSQKDITQFYFEPFDGAAAAHIKSCSQCGKELDAVKTLVGQGQLVAREVPTMNESEQVWEGLVRKLDDGANREQKLGSKLRWIAGAAVVFVALATGVFVGVWAQGPNKSPSTVAVLTTRAQIFASDDAKYTSISTSPDEIIRLTDGTITLHVAHLKKNERLRVVTSDGVVEVRGTVFEVTASVGVLTEVRVLSGKVSVIHKRFPDALLSAGERWHRPTETEPPSQLVESSTFKKTAASGGASGPLQERESKESLPSTLRSAETKSGSRSVPRKQNRQSELSLPNAAEAPGAQRRTAVASPSEIAFNTGWSYLRSEAPSQAVPFFSAVISEGRDTHLAEDAQFWLAVALERSGANQEATRGLEKFVSQYPDSLRHDKASVMLGWKYFRAGKIAEAKERFESAIDSSVDQVRSSALQGISDIERYKNNHR